MPAPPVCGCYDCRSVPLDCPNFRIEIRELLFTPAETVLTSRGNYTAELIEVRSDGIVILAAQTFRLIPYSAVVSARFDGIPQTISGGHAPSRKDHERLRLVSRFPQGLTPELLQQLLETNGQKDLGRESP